MWVCGGEAEWVVSEGGGVGVIIDPSAVLNDEELPSNIDDVDQSLPVFVINFFGCQHSFQAPPNSLVLQIHHRASREQYDWSIFQSIRLTRRPIYIQEL